MIPNHFASILLASLVFQISFGQSPSFKVIENRRIKNAESKVWDYNQENISKSTYINFKVFLGGSSTEFFTASSYKNVAFIYVGCNFFSPVLNKSNRVIHLPLYLLDVEDKQNLNIIEINEGHSLLKKLFFRADQKSNAYFKIEFRTVKDKDRSAFLTQLARSENGMAQNITKPIIEFPAGYNDRDTRKLKELSFLIFESIDVIQRTNLEKEKSSIAYIIQPVEFRKGIQPMQLKRQLLEVNREFDPLLKYDGVEIRYPYLILDINAESYIELEGLPSNHKTDLGCNSLAEQSKRFSETIKKYKTYLSQQQRIFETNLNNIINEYLYLVEAVEDKASPDEYANQQFDDQGFLVDMTEPVEVSSGPAIDQNQLLKDYCNYQLHIEKFVSEISLNPDRQFSRIYKSRLDDLIKCTNLNFLESLSGDEIRKEFDSVCKH